MFVIELEKAVEQLEGSVTDLKYTIYWEKTARKEMARELEVLNIKLEQELQLRFDDETDLVTCIQSLRRLNHENEALKKSLKRSW